MTSSRDYTRYTDVNGANAPSVSGKATSDDYTRYAYASTQAASDKEAAADDATVFSKPPPPGDALATHEGDDLPDLRSGPKVIKGRFILEKLIGIGGMGAVYKARDKRRVEAQDRDPFVAVKLLNNKFKKHPAAFLSLQREASKSQKLAHPNIVPVYDFDRADDLVFMTMELQTGASLEKVIKNNPQGIPYSRALSITQEAGKALQYAHEHNIVHADFKPGNVFLTETGRVKIFDFGIARAVKHVDEAVAEVDTAFDPSTLGGLTPAYATWEMLKGQEPDASDDVFALACMFYELLSGQHPYRRVPVNRAWRKLIWPKRLRHILPAQWKVLRRALSIRRKRRYKSVQAFLDDFLLAAEDQRARIPFDKIFTALSVVVISGLLTQAYTNSQEDATNNKYIQLSNLWERDASTIRHKAIILREQLNAMLLTDLTKQENLQRLFSLRDEAILLYEDSSWIDLYAGQVYELNTQYIDRWKSEKKRYSREAAIHKRWLERFDVRLGFLDVTPPGRPDNEQGSSTCTTGTGPFVCSDYRTDGVAFPMVRLPVDSNGDIVIMAQREVSVSEYSEYCEATMECDSRGEGRRPITGLTLSEVNGYLRWLGEQTGFIYKLPTLSQWLYAAIDEHDDPIRSANCRRAANIFTYNPSSLKPAGAGVPNSLGLLNMVGNAQEIVRTNLRNVAIGGNFQSSEKMCSPFNVQAWPSQGSGKVGFRYVRLLNDRHQ